MKTVLIGPGAIGCLFAGLLVEAGHDVWLLDKHPERADLIARKGIRIDGIGGDRTIAVRITTNPREIGETELVFICVKAYDTVSAVQHLISLVGSDTKVFSPQNGLGNAEQIARVVQHDKIFAGITKHGSTLIEPGHIRHAGSGLTTMGSINELGYSRAVDFSAILTQSGIETYAVKDITAVLWSKLIINAAIGPLSALSGLMNGDLPDHAKWGVLLRSLVLEAASVAEKKNIHLSYNDPVEAVIDVCRKTAGNVSSMLQDIRRGRKTEIDAINEIILREAHSLGVSVPVNEDMVKRIHALE